MNEIKIRYANKEDAKWLADDLLADTDARIRLNLRGNREGYFCKPEDSWEVGFVAEIQGKPAGLVVAANITSQGCNEVSALYTRKKYRNGGVAKKLLDFAEKYAFENWYARGIRAITIDNPTSDKIFRQRGYILMGTVQNWLLHAGRTYSQRCYFKKYEAKK